MTVDGLCEHRAPKVPPLSELDAEGLEHLLLGSGLDPLGDEARADVAPEGEERDHERATCAVRVHRMDQRPVDLDELRAQFGDHAHARVPGPGVIDGDAVPVRAQIGGDPLQMLEVENRITLAEFEDDRAGIEPCLGDRGVRALACHARSSACG